MSIQAIVRTAATPPRLDPLVEARLKSLCQNGCRQVRLAIAAMERRDQLPETGDLTPAQRRALLAELKSVMAVYGDTCPID